MIALVALLAIAEVSTSTVPNFRRAYELELKATKHWTGVAGRRLARIRQLNGDIEILTKRIHELEDKQLEGQPPLVLAPSQVACEPPSLLMHFGAAAAVCAACGGGAAAAAVLLRERDPP